MFLPKAHFKEGAGFSNLEYGLMAELLGKSATASEVWHTHHKLLLRVELEGVRLIGVYRQPIAQHQIPVIWRLLPNTALRSRRGHGSILC
jgi:hypothetical protein